MRYEYITILCIYKFYVYTNYSIAYIYDVTQFSFAVSKMPTETKCLEKCMLYMYILRINQKKNGKLECCSRVLDQNFQANLDIPGTEISQNMVLLIPVGMLFWIKMYIFSVKNTCIIVYCIMRVSWTFFWELRFLKKSFLKSPLL